MSFLGKKCFNLISDRFSGICTNKSPLKKSKLRRNLLHVTLTSMCQINIIDCICYIIIFIIDDSR